VGTHRPVSPDGLGVNLLKMELFDAVACLKSSPMEFSNAFDQGQQACDHMQLFPLILEDWRLQKPVLPRC
jgi:hypothetical protein